jgi:hypothetical protein
VNTIQEIANIFGVDFMELLKWSSFFMLFL